MILEQGVRAAPGDVPGLSTQHHHVPGGPHLGAPISTLLSVSQASGPRQLVGKVSVAPWGHLQVEARGTG